MDTPRPALIAALVAAILAALAASQTLSGGFVIDDRSYVVENQSVLGERGIFSEPTPPTILDASGQEVSGRWLGLYRPLTVTTWRLNRVFSGSDPFSYHLTNLLIHALVTFLVTLLAWGWSKRIAVAWWTGILFAVHPIHVEAIGWVSGRAELLSAALSIACVIAYGRPKDERNGLRVGLAALFYLGAALSKETALPLPALLVLLDLQRGSRLTEGIRRVVPVAISMMVVIGARFAVLGSFGPDVENDPVLGGLSFFERSGLGLAVIGVAARKLLFPFDLALHYPPEPFFQTAAVVIGAVVLALIFAGYRYARKRGSSSQPGFALLAVASLPFLHLIPIGAVFGDRFWYLASAGLLYVIAVEIDRLRNGFARVGTGVLACAVIVFAATTLVRNPVFAEDRTIWEEVLQRSPDCGLAAFEIGRSLEARGLMEYQSEERKGALYYFRQSLKAEPDHVFAPLAHLKLGDHEASKLHDASAAEAHYRAMLDLDPLSVDGRIRLAMLLPSGLVRAEDALRWIDQVLQWLPQTDPRKAMALDLRGQIVELSSPTEQSPDPSGE